MSTLTTRTIVPTGTWVVDRAHSKAGFAVNHMGIATVCGEFTELQGTLQIAGELSSAKAYGTVKAASVDTNDPQRDAHLRSPEFFDAETYPELGFESTALEIIDEETLPGILVAICAAAASVSAITLSGVLLAHRFAPLRAGLLYLPEFAGAALSAIVFGFVFRTRWLHYQVLAGMIFLGAGIVVIGRVLPPTDALALTGSGLIGLGVGSSVVPALFIAGFSLPNSNLQRVFAIIEL
jgi:YceI-like domain